MGSTLSKGCRQYFAAGGQ